MGQVGVACNGERDANGSSYKIIGQVDSSDQDSDDPNRPEGISETDYLAQVAGGKATTIFRKREFGYCGVEPGSVYGAAMVMPQVARSVGWSIRLTVLAVRSLFFLCVNFFIQGYLLYMISSEELVMGKYAGRMHLCDFGAALARCPGQSDCYGPGGSEYTAERLYSYHQWKTRSFILNAFRDLFPDKENEIMGKIDPGEFGMESYYCRLICCCIYILALIGDIEGTVEMARLIYYVPSKAEPWITYEVPEWGSKEYAKSLHGWTELDLVTFKVAGMPLSWKVFNMLVVVAPKFFIWRQMLRVGIMFLMETADIVELIENSMALTFVLSMDEVICTILMSPSTKYVLSRLQKYPLFDNSDEENDSMKDAFDKHSMDIPWSVLSFRFWRLFMPGKFLLVLIITTVAIYEYYLFYCVYDRDMGWISQSLHLPIGSNLNVLSFITPFNLWPVPVQEEAVWVMPHPVSGAIPA